MRVGNVQRPAGAGSESGYAMAALLVALSVMAVMMSVALPNWHTLARREKEAELVFRGEQYARAIAMFQRQYGGAFPPNVDILVTERFLRKKYLDPMTGKDFEIITPGTAIEGIDPSELGGAAGRQGSRGATSGTGREGRGGASTLSLGSGRASTREGGTGGRDGGRGTGRGQQRGRGSVIGVIGGNPVVGAAAGVQGVRSTSAEQSLRVYNGAERYDQWLFIGTQASASAGAGAAGSGKAGADGDAGGRGRAGGGRGRGGRGETTGGGRGRGGRGDATGGGRGGGRGRAF